LHSIAHSIRIVKGEIIKDRALVLKAENTLQPLSAESVYRSMQFSYPKFFKMDLLSKWAWLAAEALLTENDKVVSNQLDKTKIAVVLATSHGCLDVDRKYQQSIQTIPSPALFVYTLSNIMLGEICIRHGFKGEQACLVSESFDSDEMHFWVNDLLSNRGVDACICGWVNTANGDPDVAMFWVERNEDGLPFSSAALQDIYQQ